MVRTQGPQAEGADPETARGKIVIALGLFVIMVAPALAAGTALAYPTQSWACSNCHPHDANVVVSATPPGCNGSNYGYQFTVSNTTRCRRGTAFSWERPS